MAICTFVLLVSFNNCSPLKFQGDGGSTTLPNPEPTEFSTAIKASLNIADAFCNKHVQAGLISASEQVNCYNSFLGDPRPLALFCEHCQSNTISALSNANSTVASAMIFDREGSEQCYSALLEDLHAGEFSIPPGENFSFNYLGDFVRRTHQCFQFIKDELPADGGSPTTTTTPSPPVTCVATYPTVTTDWLNSTPLGMWPSYGLIDSSNSTGRDYIVALGQTLSIRFVTPANIPSPGYGSFLGTVFDGDGDGIRLITISETAGCVDTTKLPTNCSSTGREAGVGWSFTRNRPTQCWLKPNTTYFYNITYGDQTTCLAGKPCCPASDFRCRSRMQNEIR